MPAIKRKKKTSAGEVPKYGWRGSPAKGVERAKRCEGSNPSFSAMSEQSSFCSGFFIYGEKQAIRPLLCSYSFSKSSARLRACSVGNTLMTAPCRYQLLANSRVHLSFWKNDNIYFAWLRHVAASCISFAATFLQKSPARSFSCVSFSKKGHAPPLVLACERALADETCFQPF